MVDVCCDVFNLKGLGWSSRYKLRLWGLLTLGLNFESSYQQELLGPWAVGRKTPCVFLAPGCKDLV